jgi:hypothetical protein
MIILLFIANYGYSQGKVGTEKKFMSRNDDVQEMKHAPDEKSMVKSGMIAVVINYSNISTEEKVFITHMIEKELVSIDKARSLIPAEAMEKPGIPGVHFGCHNAACALDFAQKHSIEFVLYGSIDRTVQGYKKPLNTNGEYPYLLQAAKNENFNFNVTLYNANTNNRIKTFMEKTGRKKLYDTVHNMARVFGHYLIANGVQTLDRNIRTGPDVELSLFGAGMLPVGRFTNIIKGGCGPGVNLGLSNLFKKNDAFILSSKYYCYSYASRGTISFSLSDIMLFIGISFPLAGKFRLIPLVGGGCQFSYARFNKFPVSSLNRYVNPLVGVRLEGDIELVKRLIVFIVPEFSVFFERKNVCMYAGAHVGLKYIF